MLAGSIFNKIGQIFVLCTLLTSYSAVVAPSELINTVDQSLRGGNPQHALDLINEALNKSPNDYTLRFHKSRALSQLGNSDEAARLLVQLENEESRPEVLNNLSWIYAANGDYKHAQASLQQALKLDPRFATIYTNLNNIYAALASEAYQKALGEKDKQVPKPHLSLITELSLLEKETAPRVVEATPPRPLPSTVPLSAQERDDIEKAVIKTVKDWARSWSKQDTASYLSHYGEDYVPPAELDRATWEKVRDKRLKAPRFIDVDVKELKVIALERGKMANVMFYQSYRSNSFKQTSKKIMIMKKYGDKWQIVLEQSGV